MSSGADGLGKRPIKMCVAGDSGTAKSGGTVSLILDGYKVRTIDVDNKIDIVLHCLTAPKSPYYPLAQELDLSEAFRYETVNHKMIVMDTPDRVRIQPQAATVWPRVERLTNIWKEECGHNLGRVTEWGDDTILILDTSTFAGYAALAYVQQLNSVLGAEPGGNEWRRHIGGAQDQLSQIFRLLCSDAVKCHVIVMAHINYVSEDWQNTKEGRTRTVRSSASDIFGNDRAYPSSIGAALGPKFGSFFKNVLETRVETFGGVTKYKIYTKPQGAVNVMTSAPFSLQTSYDVSTGMAEIFRALRGQEPPTKLLEALQKPKLIPNISTKPTTTSKEQVT